MKLIEIFHSVQGEGRFIGLPTVFVRFARCNLRCVWCDTTYSFGGGEEVAMDDLLQRIEKYECQRICITGGEPLLQKDLPRFISMLLDRSFEVSVETSGSLPIEPVGTEVYTMDLKCPASGEHEKNLYENVPRLRPGDQIKFVVQDQADLDFAIDVLDRHPPPEGVEVQFQPVYGEAEMKWLAEGILALGRPYRVLPQLHKLIWGEAAGH